MLNEVITKIFSRLNDGDFEYVVLRNYETLPHRVGNDLDILIDPKQCDSISNAIKDVFAELGYISTIEPLKMNGMLCKGVKINSDDSKVLLVIHAQFWVSCEINTIQQTVPGLSYKVFVDDLQRELVIQDGCSFFVPAPIDRFGLLLRQWIFKPKAEYKEQLSALAEIDSVKKFLKGMSPQLPNFEEIYNDKNSATEGLNTFIVSRWGKQSVVKSYGRALASLLYKKRSFLGSLIYITGPDGAGKTSVSTTLSRVLKELKIKHTHVYSMKRNLIRHMIFFVRRKIHGTSDNKFSKDPESRKFRFIMTEDIFDRDDGSVAWKLRKITTLLISISDVFINCFPVLFFRLQKKVVIVETSPYDIFIKYHMPKFRILEEVFSPLILSPNLGLLLKANEKAIALRKRELTESEIVDYYQRLDELLISAHVKDKFSVIRTDIEMTETKELVYKAIALAI